MKNKKRKVALFGIGGLICLFLVIGVSYAVWQLNLTQTNENVVTTGCFKINFTEKNDINLNNAYPIIDAEGRKLTPYEFTIENTCDTPASYQVNLEVLDSTTLMNHEYMKVMFDEGAPRVLTSYNETEKLLDNATTSYRLDMGFLEGNTSKTFTLRLWMDENTPPVEESMNKLFKSKVTIQTVHEEKMPGTLRNVSSSDENGLWKYKENITKLVIQDNLEEIPNAVVVSDESSLQDGSIMSYVVLNEDGENYTAYLQGNKMIYLNPDSSVLFYQFSELETIEGMEYLDSSKVTNMNRMFEDCSSLTSLDASGFDTTNVTRMAGMFDGCSSITSLDLSSFHTEKVTNMSSMFMGMTNVEMILLGETFDTTSVTNMQGMFGHYLADYQLAHLIQLDVSHFDTTNVTNMSYMFGGLKSVTNLDVSNFNTTNVTNMSNMFEYCSKLTAISYGENFIYKDGANVRFMFLICPANHPTHESWNGVTF